MRTVVPLNAMNFGGRDVKDSFRVGLIDPQAPVARVIRVLRGAAIAEGQVLALLELVVLQPREVVEVDPLLHALGELDVAAGVACRATEVRPPPQTYSAESTFLGLFLCASICFDPHAVRHSEPRSATAVASQVSLPLSTTKLSLVLLLPELLQEMLLQRLLVVPDSAGCQIEPEAWRECQVAGDVGPSGADVIRMVLRELLDITRVRIGDDDPA
jgi:hypothetical protein